MFNWLSSKSKEVEVPPKPRFMIGDRVEVLLDGYKIGEANIVHVEDKWIGDIYPRCLRMWKIKYDSGNEAWVDGHDLKPITKEP